MSSYLRCDIFHFCTQHGKWFEPRGISYLSGVIVRVKVLFRNTFVGD